MGLNGCIVSELETDLAFTIMKIGGVSRTEKRPASRSCAGLIIRGSAGD
jgi:hypothetical protein